MAMHPHLPPPPSHLLPHLHPHLHPHMYAHLCHVQDELSAVESSLAEKRGQLDMVASTLLVQRKELDLESARKSITSEGGWGGRVAAILNLRESEGLVTSDQQAGQYHPADIEPAIYNRIPVALTMG